MSYIPAKLYIPSPTAKDQRWFIRYWIYDVSLKKRIRVKEFDVNAYPDEKQRMKYARQRISEINYSLRQGAISNRAEEAAVKKIDEIISAPERLTIEKAIELYLSDCIARELREDTLRTSKKILGLWLKYLHSTKQAQLNITELDKSMVVDYLQYMLNERDNGPRTRNNHLAEIKAVVSFVIREYENRVLDKSPLVNLQKFETDEGRNIAFTDSQISQLIKYMAERYPRQLFLCQFMYYSFARTKEISMLKIKHIGMKREGSIYIPKNISKSKIERHIEITPAFMQAIEASGILNSDPEHYIFSTDYMPGPIRKDSSNMPRRFIKNVLRKLGYGPDYTLYSWKHTGIIKAYKSGMSIASIQQQAGWRDAKSFNTYIKSLGLLENKEFIQKMPALPLY